MLTRGGKRERVPTCIILNWWRAQTITSYNVCYTKLSLIALRHLKISIQFLLGFHDGRRLHPIKLLVHSQETKSTFLAATNLYIYLYILICIFVYKRTSRGKGDYLVCSCCSVLGSGIKYLTRKCRVQGKPPTTFFKNRLGFPFKQQESPRS